MCKTNAKNYVRTIPNLRWFNLRFFPLYDGASDTHSVETALRILNFGLPLASGIWYDTLLWSWPWAASGSSQSACDHKGKQPIRSSVLFIVLGYFAQRSASVKVLSTFKVGYVEL